ncbi:hypothetical protein PY254_06115 [Rhodanobacter sp. AS-Z3]|uniref:hypothetical protein n=1 Tax=Rhodanobacter sp. AS-Z3 TaxID=3031330 RepID=UPI0024792DDD|nr:hypothetical protein [Rhodanobacter sp. AS-Z3]WEN16240.1 hypothetical protein PY254_06115 [Rhodanobacter sp. AS-Z3]
MRYRMVVFLSACVMTWAAAAQDTSSATDKGGRWAEPAPASSAITYRSDALPAAKSSSSPFKVKARRVDLPGDQPPPGATDKAAVTGAERPWQNGQAPVQCAESPHAVGCPL